MCFSRRKRKKIDNMVVNIIKIYLKMKKTSFLSIEKILRNEKKHLTIIIKNFYFKN